MRIVGGELRGRPIAAPKTRAIRPTSDRTRESLFDILTHGHGADPDGARVLDLFAGTGALGLEALSRGAASAVFVESGIEGRGLLQTNIDALALRGRARIFRRDATKIGIIGKMQPFDLIFADPPYATGQGDAALDAAAAGGWFKPGAFAVLEERASVPVACGPLLKLLETRVFGDTAMHIFRYETP